MRHTGGDVDRYVGRRLREQRQLHGLLETQLAAQLGLGVAQLIGFEDGLRRVPPQILIKAAERFKVSVGWFFESAPAFADPAAMTPVNAEVIRFLAIPEAYPLMQAFLTLSSPGERQAAVAALRAGSAQAKPTPGASDAGMAVSTQVVRLVGVEVTMQPGSGFRTPGEPSSMPAQKPQANI